MATTKEVGVGDFVLMDKIDMEHFMKNLEVRQAGVNQLYKNKTLAPCGQFRFCYCCFINNIGYGRVVISKKIRACTYHTCELIINNNYYYITRFFTI